MDIHEEILDSLTRLRFEGELTIYHVEGVKQRLAEVLKRASEIELHLGTVSEIDTAGFQVLLMAKLESIALGKTLHLIDHSQAVVEIMELFDMAGFFGDPVLIQSKTV